MDAETRMPDVVDLTKALIAAEKLASGATNTNYQAVELYVCEWLA